MTARLIRFAALVLTAALVSSCANELAAANSVVRVDDGTVEAFEIYRASDSKPVNVGTVLGGIAGGVIGHQIGSGRDNTGGTIAGAIGGAALGHQAAQKVNGSRYRITMRLDSGSTSRIRAKSTCASATASASRTTACIEFG